MSCMQTLRRGEASALEERAQSHLAHAQLRHSRFQVDNFIVRLAGGPTTYGQYHQVLREIDARTKSLRDARLDLEEKTVDLEECPDTPRGRIQAQRCRNAIGDIRQNMAETERELARFLEHADVLRAELGELSSERIEELDAETWVVRIRELIALDEMERQHRVGRTTFDMVRALPTDVRARVGLTTPALPDRPPIWATLPLGVK